MPTRSRRTILASLGALAAAGAAGRTLATGGTDKESNTVPTDGSVDWPTYRGNNKRTGASVESAAPNSEYVTTAWQADEIYSYGGLPSEPVIADGAAYYTYQIQDLSGRGGIAAFDAETGEVRWRREGSPGDKEDIGTSYVPPTVGGGRVYFESTSFAGEDSGFSDYGGLYALDTEIGETVWKRPEFEGEETLSLFSDETVFIGGHALDAKTGETRWTSNVWQFIGMASGLVYGYERPEGNLLGLNPATGDVEQSIEADIPTERISTVALTEETICWSSNNYNESTSGDSNPHEVVALSLEDGSTRWRTSFESESRPYVSGLAIGDNSVYVHASSFEAPTEASQYGEDVQSTVYAVNAATGEIEWTFDTPTVLLGDPTAAGDSVYVGGHALPKRKLDREAIPVFRHPAVHALSVDDGSERWNYLIREPARPDETVNTARTPVVAKGRIYVGWHQNVGTRDQNVRLTALDGTAIAPGSWNLPLASTAPLARIATNPEDAENRNLDGGTTVTLDGSGSEGDIATYEWRLGESGSFDTTGQTTDVTLNFCGSLLITLRVTGPGGEQSTASITLSTTE